MSFQFRHWQFHTISHTFVLKLKEKNWWKFPFFQDFLRLSRYFGMRWIYDKLLIQTSFYLVLTKYYRIVSTKKIYKQDVALLNAISQFKRVAKCVRQKALISLPNKKLPIFLIVHVHLRYLNKYPNWKFVQSKHTCKVNSHTFIRIFIIFEILYKLKFCLEIPLRTITLLGIKWKTSENEVEVDQSRIKMLMDFVSLWGKNLIKVHYQFWRKLIFVIQQIYKLNIFFNVNLRNCLL